MATLPDLPESAWLDGAMLLQRRMIALNLNIAAWTRLEPDVLGGLREQCLACSGPQRCADDLLAYRDDPAWTGWRDYCPNAARLEMLVALQFF